MHAISIDSEAYAVGISPGSILLDINGTLGLLGERSDRALERLWRYAGLFSGSGGGGGNSGIGGDENLFKGTTNHNTSSSDNHVLKNSNGNISSSMGTIHSGGNVTGGIDHSLTLQVKKPILLRFYKAGTIYQTTLLSGKPLRGIHWATCGNFALVHKVSPGSIAAEAGVRRGSLVVGVNSLGLRTLDHAGVARCLRDKFMNGVSLLVC